MADEDEAKKLTKDGVREMLNAIKEVGNLSYDEQVLITLSEALLENIPDDMILRVNFS